MTLLELSRLQVFLMSHPNWPMLAKHQPTFFSLAGIAHKELPLSNVYAFFFDSTAPHGLGFLFAEALKDVLKQKGHELESGHEFLKPIQAIREYPINKPGKPTQWLDLLLHDGWKAKPISDDATFAILIEVKVWHHLHNNLADYWDCIKAQRKRGIVLGFRRESVPFENWVFISHLDVALAVEQRLQFQEVAINSYYQPILLHFLNHLKDMSGAIPESFAQVFAFAQRHRTELAHAQQLFNQLQPTWLAEIIAAAFGDSYTKGAVFDDRVHISPKSGGTIDYLVWFGHLLRMEAQNPSFSITLFPTGGDVELNIPRSVLIEHFEAAGRGVQVLDWFNEGWFDEMIVGKDYLLQGGTLDALQSQIEKVLHEDWQLLEKVWQPVAP